MSLIVPWLLFPAVLGVLSLGVGLLIERLCGDGLPGSLPTRSRAPSPP